MFKKCLNIIWEFFIRSFLRGKSQADKVLWYLENHGRISNEQCHFLFGIRHAPSAIRDLRKRFKKQGSKYAIENESKKGCNRFGEKCKWVDYVLVKKENRNVVAPICGTFETVYKNEVQFEQRG